MANVPPVSNSTGSVGGASVQPVRRRRWPRIVLLCIFGLVGLGAVVAWSSYRLTRPAVDAAEAFLKATADGGPAASYVLASSAFRAATPENAWDGFARSRRLTAYQSASWTARSIDVNGTAELIGTVTFQDGDHLPMQVSLVKSQEQWRVLAVRLPVSGVQPSPMTAGAGATITPSQQVADLSLQTPGGIQQAAQAQPEQRAESTLPPAQSAAASPPIDTAMPAPAGSGNSASWDTGGSPPGQSAAASPAPSWASNGQSPGLGVSSLSPPPQNFAPSAQNYAPVAQNVAPATPIVPAAKVGGICMYLFSSRAHLALDGVSCPTGLPAVPGASVRCVVEKNGQRVGMTATLQSYNSSSSHPEISCVLDGA